MDILGFLKADRQLPTMQPTQERVQHYNEFANDLSAEEVNQQAGRCMSCGVPFCHNGCPLNNDIPDFNDAVHREDWLEAHRVLARTNNFPEFTGRICPAPCESACVLGINANPVAIEYLEKKIIETAFENGWVTPNVPKTELEKSVAVIGSGPAGLAAADQLRRIGYTVDVYERNAHPGGLLRYGIPDFKLEKWVVERRVDLLRQAGITFYCNSDISTNAQITNLREKYAAVLLCCGSEEPRDLQVDGRVNSGIHFAMDFLTQNNRRISGEPFDENQILAGDKHVVVIGGGDTGADCVGTSNRQGAKSVTQIELMAKPPAERDASTPWPLWPMKLRTSSSHEEGCHREWSIATRRFIANAEGQVTALEIVDLEWTHNAENDRYEMREIEDTVRQLPCDLALLAIGFVHPVHQGVVDDLALQLDKRGNVWTKNYASSSAGVFSAGDMRQGQSLVVTAIADGRKGAAAIHAYLQTG